MIVILDEDEIIKFLVRHFAPENDFRELYGACRAEGEWLVNISPAEERFKRFVVWLESLYDDAVARLYTILRKLKPGCKKEIDLLFRLFSGFDLILYQLLVDISKKGLKRLCGDLDIPENIIGEHTDVEDIAVQLVYHSKQMGLPEKMIKYLKSRFPREPLILDLERATLKQTENLFLVSFPFINPSSGSHQDYLRETGKYFVTLTSDLLAGLPPFSVNRALDYCELLRESADRFTALIIIIGEELKERISDEELDIFKSEYFCAYFKKIPIYIFCAGQLQELLNSTVNAPGESRHLQLLSGICKWQSSRKGKTPVVFRDLADLSRQMARQVDQLIAKPVIVSNFITPQVTAAGMDRFRERKRNKIFISYAHEDAKWLETVKTHLISLSFELRLENRELEFWDDTCIAAGEQWRDKIAESLNTAGVAVFLISPHFLASSFIQETEVPLFLEEYERNKDHDLKIIPLIVSKSRFKEFKNLSALQAINLDNPLAGLDENGKNGVLGELAGEIKAHILKK